MFQVRHKALICLIQMNFVRINSQIKFNWSQQDINLSLTLNNSTTLTLPKTTRLKQFFARGKESVNLKF